MNSVNMTQFEMLALEKERSQSHLQNRPHPDPQQWIQAYRAEREKRIKASRTNKLVGS